MRMERIAAAVRELSDRHFNLLRAIERFSEKGMLVTARELSSITGLSEEYVSRLLTDLHRYGLIWAPRGRPFGYILNYGGLDALALRTMASRGILKSVGERAGVGKEADVYSAITPEGLEVMVKFYRVGRQSMTKYRRTRSVASEISFYLGASKAFASSEIEALRRLAGTEVPVPQPVYRNRHAVVMQRIEGRVLAKVKSLRRPEVVMEELLRAVGAAYRSGVVHCDLSAYNVMVDQEERVWVIDWPQWVKPDHPNARDYLRRDVRNVLDFFRRRFHVDVSPEDDAERVISSILQV